MAVFLHFSWSKAVAFSHKMFASTVISTNMFWTRCGIDHLWTFRGFTK